MGCDARSAAGRGRGGMGLVWMQDPRGDSLKGEHPAPPATCCSCLLDARSSFRGRHAHFLGPFAELHLSCSLGLKHAVSAESLGARAVSFCQEPACKAPQPCMVHSKRWGHPSPTHASQLLWAMPTYHLSQLWTWPKDGPGL